MLRANTVICKSIDHPQKFPSSSNYDKVNQFYIKKESFIGNQTQLYQMKNSGSTSVLLFI